MRVLERGELVVVPPATDLHWKMVAAAIKSPRAFHAAVWPAGAHLTSWKLETAQLGWIRHNALPSADETQRLVYMFQRYYSGIEYDLRHHLHVSAGDLWRERRWRELLGYIDQLPANTHMNRLLTQDEEHMEHLLKNSRGNGTSRPSMADWGQLEGMVAVLIDAVNANTATQKAIANPKAPKPRIDPYPRPASAAEKVQRKMQKQAHEDMVKVLLRDRPA